MYLVINADDFGYSKGVTDGIIYSYQTGVVTSTTAMCNMPDINYAVKMSSENPGLGVGVHLNMTVGRPLIKNHRTIVDSKGNFFKKGSIIREKINKGEIDLNEIYEEFNAQIMEFIKVFNRKPTHIDGHHGCNTFKSVIPISLKLGEKYGLRVRGLMDDIAVYYTEFYKENVNINTLKKALCNYISLSTKSVEIGCHPGYVDIDLYKNSSYSVERIKEVDFLTSTEVKKMMKDLDIKLVNFSELIGGFENV